MRSSKRKISFKDISNALKFLAQFRKQSLLCEGRGARLPSAKSRKNVALTQLICLKIFQFTTIDLCCVMVVYGFATIENW